MDTICGIWTYCTSWDIKNIYYNNYIIGHLTLKNDEDHTLNINVQGLTDVRFKYASSTYVENNILYNFKKKINQNGQETTTPVRGFGPGRENSIFRIFQVKGFL